MVYILRGPPGLGNGYAGLLVCQNTPVGPLKVGSTQGRISERLLS